jgi:hypothetical protein
MRAFDRAASGRDSKDHPKESLDDMARDLARFLLRLSRGEGAKKEYGGSGASL